MDPMDTKKDRSWKDAQEMEEDYFAIMKEGNALRAQQAATKNELAVALLTVKSLQGEVSSLREENQLFQRQQVDQDVNMDEYGDSGHLGLVSEINGYRIELDKAERRIEDLIIERDTAITQVNRYEREEEDLMEDVLESNRKEVEKQKVRKPMFEK